MNKAEHFVQFYESSDFPAASVSAYVLAGFEAGESCIVAARQDRLEHLEERLTSAGINLAVLTESGLYVAMEAGAALSEFMIDGMPDTALFMEYIGGLVRDASKRGRVRIFAELIAKLASDGNIAARLKLEELWNQLQSDYPFTLYCAYPSGPFADEGGIDAVLRASNAHAKVINEEAYTALSSATDRFKNVAYLQQWNKQLKAELADLEKRISGRERQG